MLQRYTVYHATNPLQMFFHDETQWQSNRSAHYRRVARVGAESCDYSLDQVFALTNHIDDCDWSQHPAVVWHATRPLRSTSVGDVLVHATTHETWMALPFGWQKVAQEP